MTDGDVVKHFADVMGVGRMKSVPRNKRRLLSIASKGDGSREKPVYEWYTTSAADCSAAAAMLMPYLGKRRTSKAVELLAVCATIQEHCGKRTHCPEGHALSGDNVTSEVRRYRTKSGDVREITHRRCRVCRTRQSRERARRVKGIKPENYKV